MGGREEGRKEERESGTRMGSSKHCLHTCARILNFSIPPIVIVIVIVDEGDGHIGFSLCSCFPGFSISLDFSFFLSCSVNSFFFFLSCLFPPFLLSSTAVFHSAPTPGRKCNYIPHSPNLLHSHNASANYKHM